MAVQPLIPPKFRAFDANGDPLSGGLLYSYEAGTATPLATYTTRAGTTANANPVVLDANGEADVWTTAGSLYKFVLKDSAGVTQWTVDNVPSASADVSIEDGNVSAPGLQFADDVDTGLYRPAANQLAVAAGGTQAVLFTEDQAQFLDGTEAAPAVAFISDPNTGLYRLGENGLGIALGGVAAARWTSTGLKLMRANPDIDEALTNSITPKNIPKAFVRAHVASAGAVTVRSGFNVASVAVSGGELQITLATAMDSTDETSVLVTEINSAATGHVFNARLVSTTVVGVNCYDAAGAGAGLGFGAGGGDLEVSVVVFGAQ